MQLNTKWKLDPREHMNIPYHNLKKLEQIT